MDVYEPAEDSFLLKKQINFSGKRVLDMGTGSGILAIAAYEMGNDVTAVDINPEAIKELKEYSKKINLIESDLFENVTGNFDVILFNAPYLPTENEDIIWDGGPSGREVIERFREVFEKYLTEDGHVLLLISSLTGLEETLNLFSKYETEIVDQQKISWETLYIIKIKRGD